MEEEIKEELKKYLPEGKIKWVRELERYYVFRYVVRGRSYIGSALKDEDGDWVIILRKGIGDCGIIYIDGDWSLNVLSRIPATDFEQALGWLQYSFNPFFNADEREYISPACYNYNGRFRY